MEVIEVGSRLVIWDNMRIDLYTPVSAFMLLRKHGAVFLLESVESGEKVGRFSFIGFSPEEQIVVKGDELETGKDTRAINRSNIREVWNEIFKYKSGENNFIPGLKNIPFIGGWAGYIAYEFISYLDEINLRDKYHSLPLVNFFRTSRLLVFDRVKNAGYIIVTQDSSDKVDALKFISSIKRILAGQMVLSLFDYESSTDSRQLASSLNNQEFIERVCRAKEYIKRGEIFQAVLSIKFSGEMEVDPFEIYRALRIVNPSPYMFFFDFGGFQLIGSSPESHVKVTDEQAIIRPIAGTRKRGENSLEDARLEAELLNHKKERAEHIMLIDLARNDLGKICLPGSVIISEQMKVEKYSHVMHMVSQVEGKLKPETTFFDIMRATFPAGTVTGAPKLRAMEIIDELEPVSRGPYGGVVGYLSDNGQLDFCIGIRMIICQGGSFEIQGGAGIVFDSVPEHEYKEIRNKIAALIKAVQLAENRRGI